MIAPTPPVIDPGVQMVHSGTPENALILPTLHLLQIVAPAAAPELVIPPAGHTLQDICPGLSVYLETSQSWQVAGVLEYCPAGQEIRVVGEAVGAQVGELVGRSVGSDVGEGEGAVVGADEGILDGEGVGTTDGDVVGNGVGIGVGA